MLFENKLTLLFELSCSDFVLAKLLFHFEVLMVDDFLFVLDVVLVINDVQSILVLFVSPIQRVSLIGIFATYLVCSTRRRMCSSFFCIVVFMIKIDYYLSGSEVNEIS